MKILKLALIRKFGSSIVDLDDNTAKRFQDLGYGIVVSENLDEPIVDKMMKKPVLKKGAGTDQENPTKKKVLKKKGSQEKDGKLNLTIDLKK